MNSDKPSRDSEIIRGNEYVYLLIDHIARNDHCDPYKLSETTLVNFYQKFYAVVFNGEMKIYNASVVGLKSICSSELSSLKLENDVLNLKASFTADKIDLSFNVLSKFMAVGPNVQVKSAVNKAEVTVEISINPKTRKGKLNKLFLNDLGHIEFSVSGLGPLNSIASVAINGLVKFCSPVIRYMIEKKIKQHVSKMIESHLFPIEENPQYVRDWSVSPNAVSEASVNEKDLPNSPTKDEAVTLVKKPAEDAATKAEVFPKVEYVKNPTLIKSIIVKDIAAAERILGEVELVEKRGPPRKVMFTETNVENKEYTVSGRTEDNYDNTVKFIAKKTENSEATEGINAEYTDENKFRGMLADEIVNAKSNVVVKEAEEIVESEISVKGPIITEVECETSESNQATDGPIIDEKNEVD